MALVHLSGVEGVVGGWHRFWQGHCSIYGFYFVAIMYKHNGHTNVWSIHGPRKSGRFVLHGP